MINFIQYSVVNKNSREEKKL